MTDKEREIIENCEISDILNIKDIDDILSEIPVTNIALHYDLGDILDEYRSDYDIAEYLNNKSYDFSNNIQVEENTIDDYDDTRLLVEFCRRHKPYGILSTDDLKSIINEYIDNLSKRCYTNN